jgi:menaquinone-dependent protoporphyrinogen oxidase
MRILVVHAGREGQSAKIAAYAAKRLTETGHSADCAGLKDGEQPDPAGYSAFIAVGSVHIGQHEPELKSFVERNLQSLSKMPGALFSVSLSAAEGPGRDEEGARQQAQAFLDDCGWTPERVETLAGALRFSKYGMITRVFMQQLMKRVGVETDRRHDIEYTDWSRVDRAIDGFVEMVREKISAAP